VGNRRRRGIDREPRRRGSSAAGARTDRGSRRPATRALPRPRGDVRRAHLEELPPGSRDRGGARMKVGVPSEVKRDEYRVALTTIGVRELTEHGHDVLIEAGAGEGSAIVDAAFEAQGARIVPTADDVWSEADLVLKVKEPQAEEVPLIRSD